MSHKKYKEKAHPVGTEDIIVVVVIVQLPSRIWVFATPWNCSMSDFPGLHYLLEFAQTHVHWVGDAIQLSHSLSCTSPLVLNPSQHQSLFQWVSSSGGQSIGASASTSALPMNIQGWFPLQLTGLISLQSKGHSRVFSSTTVWKPQFFSTQASYGSVFTAIQDYWKNHSFDCTDLCQQSDVSSF